MLEGGLASCCSQRSTGLGRAELYGHGRATSGERPCYSALLWLAVGGVMGRPLGRRAFRSWPSTGRAIAEAGLAILGRMMLATL